eukprot:EG_transcript_4673
MWGRYFSSESAQTLMEVFVRSRGTNTVLASAMRLAAALLAVGGAFCESKDDGQGHGQMGAVVHGRVGRVWAWPVPRGELLLPGQRWAPPFQELMTFNPPDLADPILLPP